MSAVLNEPSTVTENELKRETERQLRGLSAMDVLDELADASEELQAAIEAGNAIAIGLIVLDVRRAFALRLACRVLYDQLPVLRSTKQVAALALIRGCV